MKARTAGIVVTLLYMLCEQRFIGFVKLDAAYELRYAWHPTVLPAASASTQQALQFWHDPA